MPKLSLVAGTTSKLIDIFIQDTSVTTGAGLTGLTSASGSLTWYYYREGAASATAVSITSMTLGTFTSSGFIVVDGTNMPGVYQLGVPNAAIAAGAKSVVMMLKGAANMAQVLIEIELTAWDNQDGVRGGLTALPNATVSGVGGLLTAPTTANVGLSDLSRILGTALTETAGLLAGGFKKFFNVSSPTGTLNSIPDAVAGATGGLFIAGTNAATTVTTSLTTTFTGNLTGSVGSVTGAVGSVAGAVGSVTGNVGGNVTGSVGSVAAGGIAAASFAANAIDSTALATSAVNEIADGLLDRADALETGITVRNALRGYAASLLGKLSGAGTTNILIRDINDTKNVVNATVDVDGNRSAVTLDLT